MRVTNTPLTGEARSTAGLPPLPQTTTAYLAVLLTMVVGFYVLLLALLALTAYALYRLVLWTPTILGEVHGSGAIKILLVVYGAVAVFGWAILRGLAAKTGGDPLGRKLDRAHSPQVFALIDEVAAQVQADPIHEVFLTAEDELGVWEEAALYLPPGRGKRKIVLGMGALSYLTLDQLRSILAHEYGHFSNRDTFFSRFIYRVSNSYSALLRELSAKSGKIQYFNPLYWLLRAYTLLYDLLAASFSRNREYHADRFAVEGYGQQLFAHALIAAHLEGTFFSQFGVRRVVELATEGKQFKNMYHFVGATRRQFDQDNPTGIQGLLTNILAAKTGVFHSHPSLRERLVRQSIPDGLHTPGDLPRPALDPALDATVGVRDGVPSAAEALFGGEVAALQSELSDLCGAKYAYLVQQARHAQSGD